MRFSGFVRLALAGALLWSAYAKSVMPVQGPSLYQHWLASWEAIRYLLPGIEAALAIWLVVGVFRRSALFCAILMISAFSGLLVLELTKEHPKPCGCMGAAAASYEPAAIRKGLVLALMRNALMIAGACYCYVASGKAAGGRAGDIKTLRSAPSAEIYGEI